MTLEIVFFRILAIIAKKVYNKD